MPNTTQTPAAFTPKDYLGTENARNKQHAALFTAIIVAAFGPDNAVLIGHHLTFETAGDIATENEIPSADTLIFDHDIMGRVFGQYAPAVMMNLARVPVAERDTLLKQYFDNRGHTDHPAA